MNRISNWLIALKRKIRFKKSATVRTMFSLLSIASLLGIAAVTSSQASYIRLEADKTLVESGNQFALDVYANAHVPVNAVDVTLRFEESAVEVIGVDRGQSVLTIWTVDPIITKDSVTLRGGTFRKGFIGEHRIATINLRAKKTGQSQFSAGDVMLLAGDGKGTPVSIAESNQSKLSLYIYDESTDLASIAVNTKVSIVTDLDGDGKVTLKDISSFMAAWANQTKVYDFNGDGKMSFRDFSIILADFFTKN